MLEPVPTCAGGWVTAATRHAPPPPFQGQAGQSRRLCFVAELPPDTPGAVGAGHGGHWGPLSPQGPARITGGIQKPLQGKVTVEEAINTPRLCSS